ncbi:unnamed protein product [Ceratitis capitata]|uniref:(Mediterranean fruit fly) hypothetical protein n=1 Tax=Ceratitis capitata TaxID=7213 RepID=A0A811VCR9_CERCA|nr:unnamed protein product [Ceratitis capitata]
MHTHVENNFLVLQKYSRTRQRQHGSDPTKSTNDLSQKFEALKICDASVKKKRIFDLQPNFGKFKPVIILSQYYPTEEIKLAHSKNFAPRFLTENKPFLKNFLDCCQLQPDYVKEELKMMLQIEDIHTMQLYCKLYQTNLTINDSGYLLSFEMQKQKNCNFMDIVSVKMDEVVFVPLLSTREAKNQIRYPVDLLQVHNHEYKIDADIRRHVRTLEKFEKDTAYVNKYEKIKEKNNEKKKQSPKPPPPFDLKKKYNVIIRPNRYNFRVQYRALELLDKVGTKYIFPTKSLPKVEAVNNFNLEIINEHICENPEQLQAVRRIVNGANPYAPYIIVGPPGTGKTTTIVEAILQIYIHEPNSRILITTSSNSACDTVALKLCEYFENNQKLIEISEKRNGYDLNSKPQIPQNILRVYSISWIKRFGFKNINPLLKRNANFCDAKFESPSVEDLKEYSIIAVTLCTVGRLRTGINGNWPFTHIFIDEAGATTEVESLVAITSVNTNKCRVILSGDTKQLGPVVMSKVASKCGLKHSLMERLQACDYYKVEKDGTYDDGAQTRLRRNYRSHPNILQLFNHLYYNDELIAEVEMGSLINFNNLAFLKNKKFPIIFESVYGTLSQDITSCSSYNKQEAYKVISIITKLKDHVDLNKIGVISPYRLQCDRLKDMLRRRNLQGIEVGTAEIFQGREKHVIIASFVKSFCHLGFVTDPQRLNVMLSRAQSLLILVGNPKTLAKNNDFMYLIEECKRMGTFHKNK